MTSENCFCFIACVNDPIFFEECKLYISLLHIPNGYSVNILSVTDAASMAAGYNEGMTASNAKYKIYLHQDTFIVDRYLLYEILDIFGSDDSIGMIGAVGSLSVPSDGCMWNSDRVWCTYHDDVRNTAGCDKYYTLGSYDIAYVKIIDGLLIITNHDISWREDIFMDFDFYDASQSMEFAKQGYRIVVPRFDKPICVHDDGGILELINYNANRLKFLREYMPSQEI